MFKKFPTPVLKPYWPFFASGAAIYWVMSKVADASANSAEFINDPRHPRFARGEKPVELAK
ncbi:AaceriAER163Wp [[Ashbya] aceris (nom. inval.)]|nr:AaceriAER163Wp [[Ashbya] aceris (nom. inval.)]